MSIQEIREVDEVPAGGDVTEPLLNPYEEVKTRRTPMPQIGDHDEEVSCTTKLFMGFRRCFGFAHTCCCAPCACMCGSGPVVTVDEGARGVVLEYGQFKRILPPGVYHKNVGTEKYIVKSIRVQTIEIPTQRVMTRDNVSLTLDACLFYRVVDIKKAVFNVASVETAMRNLSQSTIETMVGEHTLGDVFAQRQAINDRARDVLEAETSEWGIEVVALELRDIRLPENMTRVMAAVAEAQREGEAHVVQAMHEKRAASLYAQAADRLAANPVALQLRYFATLSEIAAEKNSTVIVPSEITSMFKGVQRWDEGPTAFGGSLSPEQRQLLRMLQAENAGKGGAGEGSGVVGGMAAAGADDDDDDDLLNNPALAFGSHLGTSSSDAFGHPTHNH